MSFGQTLRWAIHLRPNQIGWRLLRKVQRRFLTLPAGQAETPLRFPTDPWPGCAENGRRIARERRIRLLNLEHVLHTPVDWAPVDKSPLWRFTLNYFDWLADLKAVGDAGAACDLIADWISSQSNPRAECWHPYPLSLRLFAWLRFAPWLLQECDGRFKDGFLSSIRSQADLLARLPEYDVGGNHLIKNLKALIAAAVCLQSQGHRLERWLSELQSQLDEQILRDGCHYERSPAYHLQVLVDLIDIFDLLPTSPAWLGKTIDRMYLALATLRHPDGGLALFNDGDTGDSSMLQALDARFGPVNPPALLPDAGYARLEAGNMVVIFDAGPCCPDHLTAHAHADCLSFEMSVGKQRVIVNGGTYAYQDPLRGHFRGSSAHSTVVVDGQDCAEVFGTFRLGRRPRRVDLFKEDGWIVGRHDGYRHLGVAVERRLRLGAQGLEGEDRVTGTQACRMESVFLVPSGQGGDDGLPLSHDGNERIEDARLAPSFNQLVPGKRHVVGTSAKTKLRWTIAGTALAPTSHIS